MESSDIISYDYIICGGGMSGLSLAYHLSNSKLSDKKILIIEPETKNQNDRTWAFWEQGTNPFDEILAANWQNIGITDSSGVKKKIPLKSYAYKLIRGIDFYEFVNAHLAKFPNITFKKDRVLDILDFNSSVTVKTEKGNFKALHVFDSTFKLDINNPKNINLLQHFKGYVVKSEKEVFDLNTPDMMDFSIPQKSHEGRFMYILPLSKNKALVEFTVFSERLLDQNAYTNELEHFLTERYPNIIFEIEEEEFGVIPMSDVATAEFPSKNVSRIGTAAGYTNPATGYTFANTQRKLLAIVQKLEKGKLPSEKQVSWFEKRHELYASTLLYVIAEDLYPMAESFKRIFNKNDIESVFRFLDKKSSLWDEIKIMWSTPKLIFGKAFLLVVFKKLKGAFL